MSRRSLSLALALPLALLLGAATPVPSPVEVRAGAATADGVVAWSPPVQIVTGEVGDTVAIDLALDDGTDDPIRASLSVHEVTVDEHAGPAVGNASAAITLASDRIALGAGDRGILRGVTTVPPVPSLLAVRAQVEDAAEEAAPTAFVLVGPAVAYDLDVEVAVVADGTDGERARVTVRNHTDAPAVVDVAVAARTWVGAASETRIRDVLVGASGARSLEVEVAAGVGRRRVAVAAAARGGAAARNQLAHWPARTPWVALATALVIVATTALVQVWRRRDDRRRHRQP